MELLRSHFRQTAEMLDSNTALTGRVYFKNFGDLEFEKYLSLKQGMFSKKHHSFG